MVISDSCFIAHCLAFPTGFIPNDIIQSEIGVAWLKLAALDFANDS
jgi:hypothetical protein